MEVSCSTRAELLASLTAQLARGLQARSVGSLQQVLARHNLLGDLHPAADPEDAQRSKDAVEAWIDAVLALLGQKNEASRQMGSTLLQTTMHESSTQTFIEHYSTWFARLLALVKGQPSASLLQSLWTALATLFGKVGQLLAVAGVRREGSGMVAKLLPTLLPLLEHPGGGAADVAMAHALHAALIALPSACRAHLKPLEQYASQAVLADTGSTELQRVAAACLAALPGVTGDAASWSAMVQRLLVTLHDTLDTAFMGMDDAGLRGAARAALDPGAISLAGPASAAALLGASQHTTAAALKRLAGLLDCLERLMTQGYPVAVPLPSNGILLLLTRILSMDDSTGRQPPSASAYLELCGQLPELHATALELLITLLRAGRGALTPLFASMCRLMGDLMRRIAAGGTASFTTIAWTVRQGVYKTAAELERQAHAGAGSRLAAEALAAAVLELYGPQQTRSTGGGEPGPRKRQKKAKAREEGLDGLATGQMVASAGAAVQVPSFIGWQRELAVQQASLGLLEVILKVTGSSLPGPQRVQLDSVVVHVANTAVQKLGQEPESGGREGPVAELQLAAYRALLASVVAPSAHRPPFLPQALALFRQGLHASSPALAQLCRQALISCEAILHPRCSGPMQPLSAQRNGLQQPSTAACSAHMAYLGVPRMWSAFDPTASIHRQPLGPAAFPTASGANQTAPGPACQAAAAAAPPGSTHGLAAASTAAVQIHAAADLANGAAVEQPAAGTAAGVCAQGTVLHAHQQSPDTALDAEHGCHPAPEHFRPAGRQAQVCSARGGIESERAAQAEPAVPAAALSQATARAAMAPMSAVLESTQVVSGPGSAGVQGSGLASTPMDSSSDSEGELPAIDSGGDSSDEEDA